MLLGEREGSEDDGLQTTRQSCQYPDNAAAEGRLKTHLSSLPRGVLDDVAGEHDGRVVEGIEVEEGRAREHGV